MLFKKLQYAIPAYLYESYSRPEEKDLLRIKSMLNKARNNDHLLNLAQNMANAITHEDKAYRRFLAALDLCGETSGVTVIFAERCIQLGVSDDNVETVLTLYKQTLKKSETEKNIDIKQSVITQDEIKNDIIELIDNDNYDIEITNNNTLLRNTPLEYAEAILNVHKIIANKIKKYNIIDIIEKASYNVKLPDKMYIKNIDVFNFDINTGIVTLSIILGPTKEKITTSLTDTRGYGWISVNDIKISLIDFSIAFLNNYNKMTISWAGITDTKDTAADFTQKAYDLRYLKIHHYDEERVYKCIELILVAIENELLKISEIKQLFTDYQKFLSNLSSNNNGTFKYQYNENSEKLAYKLTNLICDAFDVDNEPDDKWPGFIVQLDIKNNNMLFMPYHKGHFIKAYNKYQTGFKKTSRITGLTIEQENKALFKWLEKNFGKNNVTQHDHALKEYIYFSVPFNLVKEKIS